MPLGRCICQVLVSGEHLTAEAPGDGMAPRFITQRTCFFIYIYKYIYIYTFFFYYAGSLLPHRLSLVVASRGYSSLWCMGFSLQRLLLLQKWALECGFQSLWLTGLAALRHMGSSRPRDQTQVPCISRLTPIHCTTREVSRVS